MASSSEDCPPSAQLRDLRRVEVDVARILAETAAPVEACTAALEAVGRPMGWTAGAVWELDADAGALRRAAVWTPGVPVAFPETLPGAHRATPEALGVQVALPLRSAGEAVGLLGFCTGAAAEEPGEEVRAALAAVAGLVAQLVARNRAEAALGTRESRLRAMLDASLDAVVTIDADGRVLAWNHAAEAIFGHPAAEATGREIAELIVPPALRDAHRRGLRRFLETGRPVMVDRRVELTGMRRDGREFPVELAIRRIDVPGPPTFTGYLRDISDRVQAARELQASRRRLVTVADAERRTIQHALRDGAQQRLTSVLLSLGRLRAGPRGDDPLLHAAFDELTTALREIRELASGLHPTVLAQRGLAAALEALALRAPAPLDLRIEHDRRLPEPVEAAAYHVVAEALLNVLQHAGAGQVVVRTASDDRQLVVEIVDDGVGGADPGGAGLRSAADRVQALDGRLVVERVAGGGTRVRAAIPHGG